MMINKNNRNDVKKNASTLNSKWLQNTLKSMGVAGTEMIKDMMPATGETISSARQVAQDAINSVRSSRPSVTRLAKNLKTNSGVKMGQDFFRNALEDLKTGNLYNTERESSLDGFDDFNMDTDTLFGDIDDLAFGDEENAPDINVVNQEINRPNDAATIKAIDRSAEYQVRSAKATVDTMVSIASTSMMNTSKIGAEIVSQLTNINSNLAAIIEYNNTNMTKFIEASIGYYEQMTSKSEDRSYSSERIKPDELYTSSGGLDFSNYKEYIKANIKDYKDNSLVGSTLSMILDNKDMLFGNLVANPIGTIVKTGMKALVPQATKTAMAALDETMKDFIPVMLERIGSLEDEVGPNAATSFISKVFGIKTKRKKNFDLSKIEKGPVPFNGYANHTIVEIIPKYLRESNAYLREIAEAVTGKNEKDLRTRETGFDWESGTFKNLDEMRKNVYDEIQSRATSEFRSSKFGDKMSAQVVHLKSRKDQENYDNALDQLYSAIERHSGKIDFGNKDHMSEIMSGINASDSIKNLIESYIEHLQETADEAIGSAISAKQRATRERNQAMRDVEESATERGIRQFVDKGSYDDYIKGKYAGSRDASVSGNRRGPAKVNASVPSLIQGIQDTLNRGIYVQIKARLGNDSSDSETTKRARRIRARSKNKDGADSVQSKEEFKNQFAEDESDEASIEDMLQSDNPSIRERFGRESSKQINAFKGVLDGIMAGNSDKAFEEFVNGIRGKFRQAGEFLSEHFFTPMKEHLFGKKDENGYRDGGIFEGVNNRMKESFYSLRRMITGKGYIDAEGNQVPDANDEEMKNTVAGKLKGMLTGLKDGIREKLFGKKAENEDEEDKEGLLPKAKKKLNSGVSSLLQGLTGWKHALFGESDDEVDPEEEGKKTLDKIKEKAKDVLPSALTGSLVGAVGGTAAGGILGTLVGGPVGGALLGLAGGIASRSDKFKDWLFGPKDKDGKRIGGVISEKVQDYAKKNGKYLAGGAALGLAKGVLTGSNGGILGALVGGPLAGAIMGIGTSMIIRSNMFQKFLFGDEKAGQKGLVNTVKGWFGNLGKGKSGEASGGKLAGMMGIGAGVGAITLGTLSKVGLFGLSLGPAGPIGGALLGLGGAILAQKKNFKEWLFGKTDPETGVKKQGIIGKFGNMLSVTVFQPMANTMKDVGRRFKTTLYYDVLGKFNIIAEKIGNGIFGTISKVTGKAVSSLASLGDVIKEDFLLPTVERFRKILKPITGAINTVVKGIYNVGTTIMKAPINLLYGIVSPIGTAIGKTLKGVAGVIGATISYGIVKPIKNLVIKPLTGAIKLATNIITAPFKVIGDFTNFVTDKMSKLTNRISLFVHNVGQDFKEWIFKKNPIAKGIRAAGAKVKEFGARIKDTFKIMVSPLTDFVKSALTEVKDRLTNGIHKFFSMLNPINWVKKIYGLITGNKKKKEKDPTKMGYFRRAWEEAGRGVLRDAPEGMAENGSVGSRRRRLAYEKKYGRERTYYYDKDGNEYRPYGNSDNYYEVTGSDGKKKVISADELPDKSTLTEKTYGVDGKLANKEKRQLDRARQKNRATIAKATKYNLKEDTLENREIAKQMMAKKGKTIHFEDVETEDEVARMREVRLQEDTLDATEGIKENTYESKSILKNILDTVTFGMTMSPEERRKLSEHKQILKQKAAFLGGYDGKQSKEDAMVAKAEAEELANHQAETLGSDAYKDANKKSKKKTDDKYSGIRTRQFEDNFTKHGFFGGLKANFSTLGGYLKGGVSSVWSDNESTENTDATVQNEQDAVVDETTEPKQNTHKVKVKRRSRGTQDSADIPKHARGTISANAGLAIVGEKGPEAMYRDGDSSGKIVGLNGPEVVNLKGGEKIIPNSNIAKPQGDGSLEHSKLSDDSIAKTHDSKKLTIGERIIKELLGIKSGIAIAGVAGSGLGLSPEGSGTESDLNDGSEYDTTNINKLKNGIKRGVRSIVNMIPGSGLVRRGIHTVGSIVGAGKTVVGAAGEAAHIATDKIRKAGNSAIGGMKNIHNKLLSRKTDNEREEAERKENEAQASVSTLTAESRHAAKVAQDEEDSDDAREDAKLTALQNIEGGQREHSKAWNFIFSRKGLITGGLLLLAPMLVKFIKNFSKIGATIKNWVGDVFSDLKFGLSWLGDGKNALEKLSENVSDLGGALLKFVTGDWIGAVKDLILDENGNVDHQSGARAKSVTKRVSRGISKIVGLGNTKKGSKRLIKWGKKHAKTNWNKLIGAETVDEIAEGAVIANADDAAEGIAKNAGEKLLANNVDDIARSAAIANVDDVASGVAKNVGEKLVTSSVDDMAEGAAKAVIKNGGKEAVEKITKTSGLWEKAMKFVKEGVEFVCGKVMKGKGSSKILTGLMGHINKCKKFASKVTAKLAAIFGLTTALGATVIGLAAKESTWVTIGAVSGATGAKRLFRTDDVDGLMVAISTAIGALLGSTPGSVIDVLNELVVSVTGIDIVTELATLIYEAVMTATGNEDKAIELRAGQEAFQQKYVDEQNASLARQYETMQKAGLLDKSVTLEQYQAGAKTGDYTAKIQSFADYNDEQHKTIFGKGLDFVKKHRNKFTTVGGALLGGPVGLVLGNDQIRHAVFGTKDKYLVDSNGNQYRDNGDGTYQVTDSQGNDIGAVSKDAVPKDAKKVVNKKDGLIVKGAKAAGRGIKSAGLWVKDKVVSGLNKVKSFAQDKISDFKELFSIEPIFDMMKNGDVKGIAKYGKDSGKETDDYNSTISKVPVTITKIGALPISAVIAAAKKISSGFKKITSGIKNTLTTATSQFKMGDELLHEEGINLKKYFDVKDDEGSPLSGFIKTVAVGARAAAIPVALIRVMGKRLWEKMKGIAKSVIVLGSDVGQNISDIFGYVKSGDPVGMWKADAPISEDNPLGFMAKGISIGAKAVATTPAAVSWAGHKVWDGIKTIAGGAKALFGDVGQNISDIFGYVKSGDPVGMWKADAPISEDNPLAGLAKGISIGAKAVATTPAAVSWVGHKVWDGIKTIAGGAKAIFGDVGQNISDIFGYVKSGDPVGMWKADAPISEDNPLGLITKGISIGAKAVATTPAAVSWVGHKVWDGIKTIAGGAKAIFGDVGQNISNIFGYVKSGDPISMWKEDAPISEDTPLAGLVKGISIGAKAVATTPAAVSWVGHKVWDGIKTIAGGAKAIFGDVGQNISDIFKYVKSGDPVGMWKADAPISEDTPLSGLVKGISIGAKTAATIPAAVSWVGHKVWDGIKILTTPIGALFGDVGQNISNIFKYVKSGDPVGMWKADAPISEDNPLGLIAKGISIGAKGVATIPAAVSWVGHKVWDGIKTIISPVRALFGDVGQNISNIFGYVKSGDPVGMWRADAPISEDNPLGLIAKGISISSKTVATIPAAVSWAGHKVWDGIKTIISPVRALFGDVGQNISNIFGYVKSGDPVGMWGEDAPISEDNPLGFIAKGISIGAKAVATTPAAVSWVGHKVWDGIKTIADGTKAIFGDVGKNISNIFGYVKSGDPVGMWKADASISEDTPLAGLVKGISIGAKGVATIPAAVSWAGHKVWNALSAIPNAVKSDKSKFDATVEKISAHGSDAKFDEIWSTTMTCDDRDPLAAIWHALLGVVKLVQTVKAGFMWVKEKASDIPLVGDWMFGGITDAIQETEGTTDSPGNGSATVEGGSGDGTNDIIPSNTNEGASGRATITNVNDIHPIDNSTVYYSQKDPRWASTKFEQSDGTDDGATIGNTGCGPTAMAMVVSDVTGKDVEPTAMAKLAQRTGNRDETGVNWNFINTAADAYNVDSSQVTNPSAYSIKNVVSEGKPVVLLGQNRTGSEYSPYTRDGHYVVATGIDSYGNVNISDPRGLDYSTSIPASQLAPETVSMWSFNGYSNTILPKRKRNRIKRGGRGNEYLSWLQTDSRWGNKRLGKSNDIMAKSGCAVTSVAILTVYSNSIIDPKYDPGYLCDYLSANGGFDSSGKIKWNVAPGLAHVGRGDFKSPSKQEVIDKISELMKKGYYVTLCVNNGNHYVAILGVIDGVLTMSDPAQNNTTNVFDKYSASSCDSYHYFKGSSTPVTNLGTMDSNAGKDASVVDKAKSITSSISEFGDMFSKYVSTLFNAVLTGNYDIDWDSVFADESETSSDTTSSSATIGDGKIVDVPINNKYDNKTNIWRYLVTNGLSEHGAAALMGNWAVESGFMPNNLENSHERGGEHEIAPGYTDESYTSAIDSGSYSKDRFASDSTFYTKRDGNPMGAGYGLAQWTSADRKKALYDATVGQGKSIADLGSQLKFALSELSTTETGGYLKTANDYREAALKVLYDYEMSGYDPSSDGPLGSENDRVSEAKKIYDKFHGTTRKTLAVSTGPQNASDAEMEFCKNKIKSKYGHYPTWDSAKEKYYVYDKTGHKIYGTLRSLAGLESGKTESNPDTDKKKEILSVSGDSIRYKIPDEKGLMSVFGAYEVKGGRGEGILSKLNGSTYYSQNDPRWSNDKFVRSDGVDDGATIGDSGCGPTAMAMALSEATGQNINPTETAQLAQMTGDRDDTGVNWNFVDNAARYYGVNSVKSYNPNREFIENSLKTGSPVVLSGQSNGDVNSPYTTGGHYVVAVGTDNNGNAIINDPRGKSYSKSVNIDNLVGTTGAAWLIGNKKTGTTSNTYYNSSKKYKKRGGRGDDCLSWLQTDPRWADKRMGTSSETMAQSGCAVTSVAILTAYSKSITNSDYNPGYLCDYLNNNGGLDGNALLNWNAVPGLSHIGRGDFSSPTEQEVISKMTELMNSGYYVTLCVNNGGHYVAIIGLVNGVLTMSDPAQNSITNVFDKYPASTCDSYHYFEGSTSPIVNLSSVDSSTTSDATLSETTESSDMSSIFTRAGDAMFKAALTGNWDIDWDKALAEASAISATSTNTGNVSLPSNDNDLSGSDNAEKIRNYLRNNLGFSEAGAAGAMGNWMVESGLDPTNLENTFESRLGYSDSEYTAAIDSGRYSKQQFMSDAPCYEDVCGYPAGAGYGLGQWTSGQRKGDLYDATVGKGLSIGSLSGQLNYAMSEMLSGGEKYDSLLSTLRTSNDYNLAASEFLAKFEGCPNHSSLPTRQSHAKELYERFNGKTVTGGMGEGVKHNKHLPKHIGTGSPKPKKGTKEAIEYKKRGGRGEGPTVNTSKYSLRPIDTDLNNIGPESVPVQVRPSAAMSAEQKRVTETTTTYSDETMEKLMKEVINILGVISTNSGNLSLLNDIKSGLSGNTNNIVSNTTNTTVNANGKNKTKQTNQTSARMSRNEEVARKIAFGS